MNFVFLMAPLETISYKKDTTFALMVAASDRGHRVYHLPQGGMCIKNRMVCFKVTEVIAQKKPDQPFLIRKKKEINPDDIDVVFVRTDPPFDEKYLHDTWLLDHLPKRIAVINSTHGLRTVNEKIWVTQFSSLVPRTIITRDIKDFMDFLHQEKKIIVKPPHLYGGHRIFYTQDNDTNAKVIFETVSDNGSFDVILQQYLSDAQHGDKRILLLDGNPLGAVLRVHAEDDHRNNFFSGGKPKKANLCDQDKYIIEKLKPYLKKLGLHFVGIDIIGKYLIEVNVTSPTCLQEMNRLYGKKLEEKVIVFAENLTLSHKHKKENSWN